MVKSYTKIETRSDRNEGLELCSTSGARSSPSLATVRRRSSAKAGVLGASPSILEQGFAAVSHGQLGTEEEYAMPAVVDGDSGEESTDSTGSTGSTGSSTEKDDCNSTVIGEVQPNNRPNSLKSFLQSQFQPYLHVITTHPMYKYYLLSHLCQHAGDWFVRIASILAIQELSSQGVALSNLVLAIKLPMVIVSPLGGYLSDTNDRRVLMVAMDVLASVVVLGYLFAVHYQSIRLFYIVTALRSAIGASYYPVSSGIVPMLVRDTTDLQYAVTMNSYAWSFMAVVGGLVAGSLTAVIGFQACYVLDCVTFLLSAGVVYFGIHGDYCAVDSEVSEDGDKVLELNYESNFFTGETFESVKKLYVYLTTCGFGLLVLMKPTASLIWGVEDVVGALFSTVRDESGNEVEGESSIRTGILYSVTGAGCLVGVALVNRITDANFPHTLQRSSIIGIIAMSFGWLLISLAPSYSWFLVFTFLRVMGAGAAYTYSTMTLQALVRPDILGRVLSVEYALFTLTEAASANATGHLEDAGYSKHMLALFGAVLGFGAGSLWVVYHWFLRKGAADAVLNRSKTQSTQNPSKDDVQIPSDTELKGSPGVLA